MNNNITYRDIMDEGLLGFCQNNLTDRARIYVGVIQDIDGIWKVVKENYSYLIRLYFEAGAVSAGQFDGQLDFDELPKTDILM